MIQKKYEFDILCYNGFPVKKLRVSAETLNLARDKVQNMYRHCQFTREELISSNQGRHHHYEDVLALLSDETGSSLRDN